MYKIIDSIMCNKKVNSLLYSGNARKISSLYLKQKKYLLRQHIPLKTEEDNLLKKKVLLYSEKVEIQKMMEDIISNSKKDENELEKKRIGSDERQLYNELEEKDDIESDELNQIAKIVLERITDKLNGTDFNKNEELKVDEQVKRLINQATSHYNLSQSYLGWCPFW